MSKSVNTPDKELSIFAEEHIDTVDVRKRIGARIGQRREMLGLKQEVLARALGKTVPAFSHYETGRNDISAVDLWKIARILRVSTNFFFDDDELRRSEIFVDGAAEAGVDVTIIQEIVDALIPVLSKRSQSVAPIHIPNPVEITAGNLVALPIDRVE
ncbi:MAG: helix-turn-helix domain-containing protein [Capsulimonadales bacterium]|nr:helix-turn-helix domain-containing protein [Capsulimonadales bacterium]